MKAYTKNILLLIASLSVSFFVGELVFRIITPKSPPGTTYGKVIKKNTDGFRDRDFVIPKSQETYRILVLGDSFTWGVGVDVEETVPKQLEKRLSKEFPRKNIEVINAAIPGYNTVEELLLLKGRGLKYEPNMLILLYNLNDIDFKPYLSDEKYDETKVVSVLEVHPGENIAEVLKYKGIRSFINWFEVNSQFFAFLVPRVGTLLRKMGLLKSVEFSWVQTIFQGYTNENPGWLESRRALGEISEICRSHDIVFIVAIYPLLVELKKYQGKKSHEMISNYLHSIEIPFIDLLTVFEGKNGRSYWINFMDGHPNAEAHRLVTNALLPIVKDHLHP